MKPLWSIVGAASVLVAIAVRLWFIGDFTDAALYEPMSGAHDRILYHDAARTVANGEVWPDGSFAYMPLYPWVLGAGYRLFGDHLIVAVALGVFCDTLTVLLIVLLARRLGAHPVAGLLGAGWYALYPLAVVYAALTMPNTFNVMLVTGLVLVMHQTDMRCAPWSAGAGFLAGVTALGFAGVLPIACVFLLWHGIRGALAGRVPWKGMALFVAAFVLPLMPVAVHNTRAEGSFVLLTTHGGFNFYMGNHDRATGYPLRVRNFRMTAKAMLEDAHRAAEQETGRPLSRAESSAWWSAQGRKFWKEQPGRAIALTFKKAALFWNHRDIDDLRMLEQLRLTDGLFVAPFWPGFALFGLLGWIGLFYARNAAIPKLVLLSGMVSLVLFFITARYRLTFVPLMAALGAAGLTAIGPTVRERLVLLLWLLPGIAIVAWPFEIRDLRPVDYHNASIQVLNQGDVERALDLAEDGLLIDPYHADLHHAKGHALAVLDQYEGAVSAFRQAVTLNPAHASGRYNLALSLAHLGRVCEAADVLEEWIATAPQDTRSAQLHAELRRLCESFSD